MDLKERLDVLLVKKGYFETREKARKSIMAGVVLVNDTCEDKPGTRIDEYAEIRIKEDINPYVSRGGFKLEKALKEFGIDLTGKTAMDVGASTGGFTDCMLKNGAQKVIAVDVGYGQLAWSLRNDERVKCLERTNIRYLKPEEIDEPVDFCSIDVSFISLKKVLPAVYNLMKDDAETVCLIKPQFEAGREKVGKHGVVRDKKTHIDVIKDIVSAAAQMGYRLDGLTYSPIKGPEGNIEYLAYLRKTKDSFSVGKDIFDQIEKTVITSHEELGR
jgi:23S rRNA (cytidine1920-2'-O)/16S rRNA (cytidine1409-2'-O)-methyltransferase